MQNQGYTGIPNSRISELNLESLTIRQEQVNGSFAMTLAAFLYSLPKPLRSLHVLLGGVNHPQDLEPILKKHGATLSSLIWDENQGLRTASINSGWTASLGLDQSHLEIVAKHCPKLRSLGINLPFPSWESITKYANKVEIGLLFGNVSFYCAPILVDTIALTRFRCSAKCPIWKHSFFGVHQQDLVYQ